MPVLVRLLLHRMINVLVEHDLTFGSFCHHGPDELLELGLLLLWLMTRCRRYL